MSEHQARRRARSTRSGSSLLSALAVSATFLATPLSSAQADSFTGAFLAARHAEASKDVVAAARYYRDALALRPDAASYRRERHGQATEESLLETALLYTVAAGDVAMAKPLATTLAAKNGGSNLAMLILATIEMRAGRFDAARERLTEATEGGAGNLLTDMLSAWTAVGDGDAQVAINDLMAEESRQLHRLFKRYHAGLIATQIGDLATAEAAFEEMIEASGGVTQRAAIAFGAALEAKGEVERAKKLYDDALSDTFNDKALKAELARLDRGEPATPLAETPLEGAAEAFYGLGDVLARDEGVRFGLLYAQLALYLTPEFDTAQILVGEIFGNIDQHDAAAEMLATVDQSSPNYPLAQLKRASALDELDRDDEALSTLRALVEREPDDADVYFEIGRFFNRKEQYEDCVEAYDAGVQRLAEIANRRWFDYFGRGVCLERTGSWDRAEENFLLALELKPDQPDVLNYLGYSLVEQGRRLDEAREMIERALENEPEPKSGYITDSLGWVLYRMGDFEGAVKHLEDAVSLSPVEPVITDHLGDALWMVGRRMEAKFQWRRALSFDPEKKDEKRIRRKLQVGLDVVLAEEEAAAAAEKGGSGDRLQSDGDPASEKVEAPVEEASDAAHGG